MKTVKSLKFVADLNSDSVHSSKTILIVSSIALYPRVPKILTAIAFNIPIVDFTWVTQGKADPAKISNYKMQHATCEDLFSTFIFSLPQVREIVQKGNSSVQVNFLKTLILRTGGQVRNAKMSLSLAKSSESK